MTDSRSRADNTMDVTNVSYEGDLCVTLDWKLKPFKPYAFGINNTQESQCFSIDKSGNLCSLSIVCDTVDYDCLDSALSSSSTISSNSDPVNTIVSSIVTPSTGATSSTSSAATRPSSVKKAVRRPTQCTTSPATSFAPSVTLPITSSAPSTGFRFGSATAAIPVTSPFGFGVPSSFSPTIPVTSFSTFNSFISTMPVASSFGSSTVSSATVQAAPVTPNFNFTTTTTSPRGLQSSNATTTSATVPTKFSITNSNLGNTPISACNAVNDKLDYKNLYDVYFMIKSHEGFSFYEYQAIELTAFTERNKKGYIFILRKSPNDDTTLKSDMLRIFEPSFSRSNSDDFVLHIKLVLIKNNDSLLLSDLNKMLTEKTHADLKLIVKDGSFDAHKAILAARSYVLSNMITSDMTDKRTNSIQLLDWESSVVEELLKYMYTGTCDFPKVSPKLFQLAYELEMTALQDLCIKYLLANINTKNIVQILELADQSKYKLESMKETAYKFVAAKEPLLVECPNFLEYLRNSISLNNIAFVLKISNNYSLEDVLNLALNFVLLHRSQVANIKECEEFFLLNPKLLWKLFMLHADDENSEIRDVKVESENKT